MNYRYRSGDVLHLMHVLRDNRTNEMDVGQRSRAGASWADYSDRQVSRASVHPLTL